MAHEVHFNGTIVSHRSTNQNSLPQLLQNRHSVPSGWEIFTVFRDPQFGHFPPGEDSKFGDLLRPGFTGGFPVGFGLCRGIGIEDNISEIAGIADERDIPRKVCETIRCIP